MKKREINKFNLVHNLYWSNIEKIPKKDGNYFFKRKLMITFKSGHYVVLDFNSDFYEDLRINFENKFMNYLMSERMQD